MISNTSELSTSTTTTTTTTSSNNNNTNNSIIDQKQFEEQQQQQNNQQHNNEPQQQLFSVKSFEFNGKKRCIVTQKENGPCPLIAIINVLSLRGDINVPEGAPLSYSDLITRLGSYLLESTAINTEDQEQQIDYEIRMNHAINILPSLINGLILNTKFSGIRKFDTSCDTNIFEALNIDLVHGWLVDPQDVELASLIGEMSYNQITERLYLHKDPSNDKRHSDSTIPPISNLTLNTPTTNKSSTSSTSSKQSLQLDPYSFKSEEEDDSFTSGLSNNDDIAGDMKIAQFLKDNSTQLSYHGLYELHAQLVDNTIAILFRNNHFSTILKYKSELFLLITDEGYINEPVIWEKLSNINGDSDFLTSDFKEYQKMDPYSNFNSSPPITPNNNNNNNNGNNQQPQQINPEFLTDEEYAKYLSDQQNPSIANDYQVALQLHHQENSRKGNSKQKKPKDKSSPKDKDKDDKCLIQ